MKIFRVNKDAIFYDSIQARCDESVIFRPFKSDLLKALRLVHSRSKLPLFHIWFTKEFKQSGLKDTEIIIFDSAITVEAANYIKKKYPNLRVIYWFWNHIYNVNILSGLSNSIEIWSYDISDCQKYNLKFNTQFYFSEFVNSIQGGTIEYDFFFVGAEKGRKSIIDICSSLIDKQQLTKRFHVIGNSRQDRINGWILYEKVLSYIDKSKCIVDILPDIQKGMSIRPLEALFFNKKLITNFKEIRDVDFYNPNNIFILGVDSDDKLRAFIESPFDKSVNIYVDKYDFQAWIKRFSSQNI